MPGLKLLQAAFFLMLFLTGLHWMSRALARTAGPAFKGFLSRIAGNPWSSFGTGFLVTALLQSSSLTTVMVVSLVNAKMITAVQGCGIIIGANVGTTITSQLLSFDLYRLAWPLLGLALLLRFLPPPRWRRTAAPLFGFALLLLGLGGLTAALSSLKESALFSRALQFAAAAPWRALLTGTAAAAALQSSSAVAGIVLGLARGGMISLPTGILMVIGADLGTCSTALVASIGMNRTARKAAWFHFFFNLTSLILALSFFPYLVRLAVISAATAPRRLANAHFLYNLLGAAALLPLLAPCSHLAKWRGQQV